MTWLYSLVVRKGSPAGSYRTLLPPPVLPLASDGNRLPDFSSVEIPSGRRSDNTELDIEGLSSKSKKTELGTSVITPSPSHVEKIKLHSGSYFGT